MAKYSKKIGGKEVGDASVYAKPHTMTGKPVVAETNPGKMPNHSKLDTYNVSLGAVSKFAGDQPESFRSNLEHLTRHPKTTPEG